MDVLTLLLALAYPLVYLIPVAVIRKAVGGRNVVAEQGGRALWVWALRSTARRFRLAVGAVGAGPGSFRDIVTYGVAPVLVLFAGSAYSLLLPGDKSRSPPWSSRPRAVVLRDLVVSPVLEEIVFRELFVRWLVSKGVKDVPLLVFGSPVAFSAAHVQNLVVNVVRGMDLRTAGASCLLQIVYTYLFGIYATILLLETGSVWVCVAAHVVANGFGFPDFRLRRSSELVVHGIGLTAFIVISRSLYASITV